MKLGKLFKLLKCHNIETNDDSMPYNTEKLQIVDMNDFSLNMLYSKYLQSAPRFENFVKASTRSSQPNVEDLTTKTCTNVDQQLIEVIIDEDVDRNEAEFYNNFFEQFKAEFEADINLKYGSSSIDRVSVQKLF